MRMPIGRSLVWALAGAVAVAAQPPGGKANDEPPKKEEAPPFAAQLLMLQRIPFEVSAEYAQAVEDARQAKQAPPATALAAVTNKFLGDFNDPATKDPAKHRKDFLEANELKPTGAFGILDQLIPHDLHGIVGFGFLHR